MNVRLSALVLLALFTATLACRCRRQTFIEAFNNAKSRGSSYAIATVVAEDRPRGRNGNVRVTYTLRIQGCPETVTATTRGNSAGCGVRLGIQKTYALPLKLDGTSSSISSCGVNRLFESLSSNERRLVESTTQSRCRGSVRPTSCQGVRCSAGNVCRRGRCVSACAGIKCRTGTVCRAGKCINACSFIRCPARTRCSNGRCVPVNRSPRCYQRCSYFPCYYGSCGPICRTYGCSYGYDCVRGQCRYSRPRYNNFYNTYYE